MRVEPSEDGWKDTGSQGSFLELDDARQAILELPEEVASDDDKEPQWSPVRIEQIELLAPVALLNEGIEPPIRRYQIVEISYEADPRDVAGILRNIRQGKQFADFCIATNHGHEPGNCSQEPPDYEHVFAHC